MQSVKKYLLLIIGIVLLVLAAGCSFGGIGYQDDEDSQKVVIQKPEGLPTHPKVLIVYFSHTGNTELAAWQIQAAVGGQLFRLQPVVPYPANSQECSVIAKQELDANKRPQLAADLPDLAQYDTVFIGYPIWYQTTPMLVRTFLEAHDFTGKAVVPFCTSDKDDIAQSRSEIAALCPTAVVPKGLTLHEVGTVRMQKQVTSWLQDIRGELDKNK